MRRDAVEQSDVLRPVFGERHLDHDRKVLGGDGPDLRLAGRSAVKNNSLRWALQEASTQRPTAARCKRDWIRRICPFERSNSCRRAPACGTATRKPLSSVGGPGWRPRGRERALSSALTAVAHVHEHQTPGDTGNPTRRRVALHEDDPVALGGPGGMGMITRGEEICSASPPSAETCQILPNSEKPSRAPSGDQVGSVAPQVIASESAAKVVFSRSRIGNPQMAAISAVIVRDLVRDFMRTMILHVRVAQACGRWGGLRRSTLSSAFRRGPSCRFR